MKSRANVVIKAEYHPYIRRDIILIAWHSSRHGNDRSTRGKCWKFHGENDCNGAIWFRSGDVLAMLHECVHIGHHLLSQKLFKTNMAMLRSYDDAGFGSISKEEKLCHLIAAVQEAMMKEFFLK